MSSRQASAAPLLLGLILAAAVAGCSGDSSRDLPEAETNPRASTTSETHELAGLRFVTVDSVLRDQCAETAELLGYAVPCPTVLPEGSQPTPVSGPLASSPFSDYYMHPGYRGFRGWAFLTVDFPATDLEGHLVISGSPHEVDPRQFIYRDPAPGERVDVLGPSAFRPDGRWIYVPPTSSSIFGGHTVLIWSEGGHTYGVGFHGRGERIKELDLALAERITMVESAASPD